MILQRTTDTYVGMYDFAVTGGAVGSYDLQIPVPNNTVVTEFAVQLAVVPTGGVGATISFDRIQTDVSPNVTTVGLFIAATALAGFGAAVGTVTYGRYPGGAAPTFNPFTMTMSISIGMSIAVAALTAGKIKIFMRGITFDF